MSGNGDDGVRCFQQSISTTGCYPVDGAQLSLAAPKRGRRKKGTNSKLSFSLCAADEEKYQNEANGSICLQRTVSTAFVHRKLFCLWRSSGQPVRGVR
jgi:hypothetical protein